MSQGKVKVPALSRNTIDAWRVADAGLPARVVHCARKLGLQTVGDLRDYPPDRLLAEPRFGQRSLAAIESFFDAGAALEAGRVSFRDLREAFEAILEPRPWEMLRLRYGLERADYEISPNFYTLQAIANRDGITRERVRQVLGLALERVQSQWARAFLRPFEDMLIEQVHAHGGIAEADVFSRLARAPAFGGLNPASTALLLSDAHPDRWTHFGQAFILAPAEQVRALIAAVRARLETEPRPISAQILWQHTGLLGLKGSGAKPNATLLLQQMEDVLLFRDGACLSKSRLPALLEELLRAQGGRASFSDLTELLNRKLHPYSHATGSSIHRILMGSDRFESLPAPGVFGLRRGAAPVSDAPACPANSTSRPSGLR